ncbi:copper resistance protein CopC [Amycolatopsis acidiphila]|uniref:Copper resistance protein CopC n=1 Tax=Amycolatopsis acidiphila TaxID=715473 RepID=A0A558AM09_9PSEU|nr:copper resistance protein CopC [Amycolatopsis acidiphila]TVT25289.1 copper resistance protein CopC [Amycolatopsis acidiphila]UIJ62412.1 copper resistance protein CopC [Amycolatopsis acidiphila]GHG83544.1 transport integral membrane protein [Amycolatopsis acidiphila]
MTAAPGRRALRATLLVLASGWLVLFAGSGAASAHAALDSTDPAQGVVLPTAPAQISLTFSESVQVAADGVRVFGPDGTEVDAGQATHLGPASTVGVGLRDGRQQGTYTVSWRVISADSHPVSGAFTFSVGHASPSHGPASAASAQANTTVSVLYAIARGLAFAAFAVLVGSVGFVLACLPSAQRSRAMRLVMFTGWAGSIAGALGCLILQGPYGYGLGAGHAFDADLVQQVLGSRLGVALQARLLVLCLAGVYLTLLSSASATAWRGWRWTFGGAGAVLAIGLAVTWSAADHAAVGLQPAIALPADVAHLVAMGLWLGGLAALLLTLVRPIADGPALVTAARRFSPIAAGSVLVLVGTGSYQAWRQLGTWSAWLSTGYGRLLLIKVLLVGCLLAAAALSRRWVRRRSGTNPRALRRSVLAEAGLAVVVLSVTALLVEAEPGRTATAAPPGPVHREVGYDTGGPGGAGRVEVDVNPAAGGPNTVGLSIEDSAGRPRDVPEFHAKLTLPARGIGPLEIPLRRTGTGDYTAAAVQIPAAGSWQLALTVRTSDLDETTVATTIEIR